MSADANYMLIRVDLQGARAAAAEMATVNKAVQGTTASTTAANAAAATSASRATRMRNAWSSVGKAVRLGALGIAGGAAVLGIAGKKAVTQMKEIGLSAAGLRRNLGMTAEQGSRWAAVAKARDIAPTSLNMAFKTLSANVSNAARGEESYIDNLKLIGLTQKDAKEGTKDFDQFVMKLADAFGKAKGGADRMNAAAKLLGRGYQSVLPMFAEGSEGLKEQLGWADKYHVTMGDKLVDDNIKLAQAERESKVAMMGLQQGLATSLLPTIIGGHDEFQKFSAQLTDPKLSQDEKLSLIGKKIEEGLVKGFQAFTDALPGFANKVGEAAPKIAGAFVQGFLHANAWGKLILGGWLLKVLLNSALFGGITRAGLKAAGKWILGWMSTFAPTMAARMAAFFGVEGLLQTKAGPAAKTSGTRVGKMWGRAFALGAILLAAPLLKDWMDSWKARVESEGNKDQPSKTPLIDLGGVPGDIQDTINDAGDWLSPNWHTGGFIPGIGDRHITAEGGEFMFSRQATAALGASNLEALHNRVTGGMPQPKSAPAGLAEALAGDTVWTSDVKLDAEKVGKATHRRQKRKAARR